MTIRFGSVCSGIEAASVAWKPLGWRASFVSEIEAFPRAVLAHHHPETPLHGDFTTIRAGEYEPIDLLVGGTPCQSFSVAGLRGGLADDRGNLALEYLRLADRLRPRWLVWENVPGVLSSNGGRDFGAILGGMVELGYGFAYRVLDAQFFGVAQRRRRVFVVGYLGGWRPPAAVLFERESLSGHPAPRREAGKAAPTIPSRSSAGGGLGTDFDCDGGLIERAGYVPPFVPQAITGSAGNKPSARGGDLIVSTAETMYGVSHADAPQTGPVKALRALLETAGEEATTQWGLGVLAAFWPAEVLRPEVHGRGVRCASFPQRGLVNVALSRSQAGAAWSVQDLWEAGCNGRAPCGWRPHEQLAAELGAYLSQLPYSPSSAERFLLDLWGASEGAGLLREALSALQEARRSACGEGQSARSGSAVRRLIVEECEALQGFPRSYTLIPWRKGMAPDGPRYKALGNSMAVPVMAWIGRRIEAVETILSARAAA